MKITKEYNVGDDYIVLRVECPPLPEKRITVMLKPIADGRVNLERQIELAEKDAQERLRIHNIAESIINDTGN